MGKVYAVMMGIIDREVFGVYIERSKTFGSYENGKENNISRNKI